MQCLLNSQHLLMDIVMLHNAYVTSDISVSTDKTLEMNGGNTKAFPNGPQLPHRVERCIQLSLQYLDNIYIHAFIYDLSFKCVSYALIRAHGAAC